MPKTIINTERLPIWLWNPSEEGPDDGVLTQFRNLANHPLAFKHICGMPDYHIGYGMPIGGVLATKGGVVPNAVGVDIGCGMIAVETQLRATDLSRDLLQALREAIHSRVPVGMKHHQQPQDITLPPPPFSGSVVEAEWRRAHTQAGTLGSGNHFIEVQRDEDNGRVWLMLHSGSRNVGLRVCNHYHKIARDLMAMHAIAVPDPDLAFLPEDTESYGEYLDEMRWCMAFAEANREAMLQAVYASFREVTGVEIEERTKVDTHHNFAQMECHFGENVLVHRKGAVKAEGLVTIPGSMGTASYIAEGLRPTESFNTCSHGAGRRLGRKQANRQITHEQAEVAMSDVVFGVRQGDYDEMPMAYKDIDAVIAAQADLVKPVHRLLPLAVVKG
jgi:tRNA-splicing ligase RtcB (3'-phosphate/5'-hydroxy nucleic acid ligase)